MVSFPVFLSVVIVLKNQGEQLNIILREFTEILKTLVSDYELIVIDNASNDASIELLKNLTGLYGYPNLQVYALTKEVDADSASWAGVENALGDFVAIIDPLNDDIEFISTMLQKAMTGTDVVYAKDQKKPDQSFAYKIANYIFNLIYNFFHGIHLSNESPAFRILSKRVVNFILQHPQPGLTYRHLPVTSGFSRIILTYSSGKISKKKKKLSDSIDRGMRLIVSNTRTPMRLVTSLSMFGAASNLIYSVYVVAVGIFKTNVAPGWISLSLQQSGMFFLISLVLLVLGEYILQMASLVNEGPIYHIAQEFTSSLMTRREKLNIEDVSSRAPIK